MKKKMKTKIKKKCACVRLRNAYARAYACVRTRITCVRTYVRTVRTCVRTRYFPVEPNVVVAIVAGILTPTPPLRSCVIFT